MRANQTDVPVKPTKKQSRGNDREWRRARKSQAASRLARPILRYLLRKVGRSWTQALPYLDEKLRRLKADRYLRQRVRQLVMRELAVSV